MHTDFHITIKGLKNSEGTIIFKLDSFRSDPIDEKIKENNDEKIKENNYEKIKENNYEKIKDNYEKNKRK